MSKLTGGALLLVLGVPLALYAALAVKSVARADLVGGDPPADRGAPKEKLADLRARAASWLAEVRKATTVAGQYRAGTPADDSPELTVKAATAAASARANDLIDADTFLSNTANPTFNGQLQALFGKWHAGRAKLGDDERDVAKWFDTPPAIRSAEDAKSAYDTALDLITQYKGRTQFADSAKAAAWRVRARLHVVAELDKVAKERYGKAVRLKLPLEPGNTEATAAGKALDELGRQVKGLADDVKQAATDRAVLPRATLDEVAEKQQLIETSAACKTLLDLFAQDDLFVKAGGAAAWLKSVGEEYKRTKDVRTRALIRDKVQEFCEAFVAPAARLDDTVLLKGKPVARNTVVVKYAPSAGEAPVRRPLSPDADGTNELTLSTKPPGVNVFVVHDSSEWEPTALKATDVSLAAVTFTAARRKAADGGKWTPNSIADLKKACVGKEELVDQLKVPAGGPAPQLWARVSGLADGARAYPELFGDQ